MGSSISSLGGCNGGLGRGVPRNAKALDPRCTMPSRLQALNPEPPKPKTLNPKPRTLSRSVPVPSSVLSTRSSMLPPCSKHLTRQVCVHIESPVCHDRKDDRHIGIYILVSCVCQRGHVRAVLNTVNLHMHSSSSCCLLGPISQDRSGFGLRRPHACLI